MLFIFREIDTYSIEVTHGELLKLLQKVCYGAARFRLRVNQYTDDLIVENLKKAQYLLFVVGHINILTACKTFCFKRNTY